MNEHYKQHTIEAIDVIHDWNLGFELGNVIKYIARYKHKGTPVKDLEKATWYLTSFTSRLRQAEEAATWDNALAEQMYENTITGTTHLG